MAHANLRRHARHERVPIDRLIDGLAAAPDWAGAVLHSRPDLG